MTVFGDLQRLACSSVREACSCSLTEDLWPQGKGIIRERLISLRCAEMQASVSGVYVQLSGMCAYVEYAHLRVHSLCGL